MGLYYPCSENEGADLRLCFRICKSRFSHDEVHILLAFSVCYRDNREIKGSQAKQSVESSKSVMSDKSIKNKAERERYAKIAKHIQFVS